MQENKDLNKEKDSYYSENKDFLAELAKDIIEDTIFYREGAPKPPLPSAIANDSEILDIKLNKNKRH